MTGELVAPEFPTPGIVFDLHEDKYHAVEAMSASGAKHIRRSPAHFKVWRTEKKEPTAQMIFGTALHLAVLEPERLTDRVVQMPEFNRRTKDGKAAAEAFETTFADKILLTTEQYVACMYARDSVARHAGAQSLLKDARKEVSMFWIDAKFQVPCKARADAVRPDGGLVDVKTTDDASQEEFGRSIAKWSYHSQGAHYISGMEHLLNSTPPFFAFIAVEREPPFGCACYVLESNQIIVGGRLMDEALALYKFARESGNWDCYPQTIQPAKMPKWALQFQQ
jgi:exodeoxyribonuclease VIII